MNSTATLDHKIVSKNEWQRARTDLLAKEKELTRQSDEVARLRREFPWTRVEKDYVFEGPKGKLRLADLFEGRSQLAVYHFMLGPDSVEGCPGCSFMTDHLNATLEHVHARDVSLVLISSGSLASITAFNKRMGWLLPWFSSAASDFNHDFGVSFTPAEVASGAKTYNFRTQPPHAEENPGLSCFYKDAGGTVYHTYSTYARGLDAFLTTYVILDRAPKGRDEEKSMSWLRHHDKYEPAAASGQPCCHS
jgi:predicted dithiol-disulfide oxidoreductase (DUF899 family)